MRTALYRHWASDGTLLYVGISLKPFQRLENHIGGSHWMDDVSRVTIEHFETRHEAEAAEKIAIKDENPAHNVVHNRDNDNGKRELIRRRAITPIAPPRSEADRHIFCSATNWGPEGTSHDEAMERAMSRPIETDRMAYRVTEELFNSTIDRMAAEGRIVRVDGVLYPAVYGHYVHSLVAGIDIAA